MIEFGNNSVKESNPRMGDNDVYMKLWEFSNILYSTCAEGTTLYIFNDEECCDSFAKAWPDVTSLDDVELLAVHRSMFRMAKTLRDEICDMEVLQVYALEKDKFAVWVDSE